MRSACAASVDVMADVPGIAGCRIGSVAAFVAARGRSRCRCCRRHHRADRHRSGRCGHHDRLRLRHRAAACSRSRCGRARSRAGGPSRRRSCRRPLDRGRPALRVPRDAGDRATLLRRPDHLRAERERALARRRECGSRACGHASLVARLRQRVRRGADHRIRFIKLSGFDVRKVLVPLGWAVWMIDIGRAMRSRLSPVTSGPAPSLRRRAAELRRAATDRRPRVLQRLRPALRIAAGMKQPTG